MTTGSLLITRTDQNVNKLVSINIYVDGKVLCTIKNNETKTFDLEPGDHMLYAKIDWTRSNTLPVHIVAGETRKVEMGSPFDVSLKPISWLLEVGILLIPIIIGLYWDINYSTIFVALFSCWLIGIFISGRKPMIYYLTFGYKEYLYLKHIE